MKASIQERSTSMKLSGKVPWVTTVYWGGPMENRARRLREVIARQIPYEVRALPIMSWFIFEDPVRTLQAEGMRELAGIKIDGDANWNTAIAGHLDAGARSRGGRASSSALSPRGCPFDLLTESPVESAQMFMRTCRELLLIDVDPRNIRRWGSSEVLEGGHLRDRGLWRSVDAP